MAQFLKMKTKFLCDILYSNLEYVYGLDFQSDYKFLPSTSFLVDIVPVMTLYDVKRSSREIEEFVR